MSVQVNFSGTNYTIPTDGDENWAELSDYLVALSTAATTLSMKYSARVANSSQSLLSSDTIVLMNVATASTATLPPGVTGQFYGIFDFTGAAATNNITITGTSGQTINGQASYVIGSNYGGVLLQFNGTRWQIISEVSLGTILTTQYRLNNATNASVIEDQLVALQAFPSVTDGQSCSFTIANTNFYKFYISLSDGRGLMCTASQALSNISAVADPSDIFLTSDAGTGVYVYKSSSSGIINIKNRTGSTLNFEIHVESGRISSATAWA